jgi:hypothetical protein
VTVFTGTIPTIAAGDTTTVSTNLATYRDALKGASEAWTTYTHGWTGTLGNGTIVAKYMRVNKLVAYRVMVTWGSTTSHAAATQTFNLPVAAHADYTLSAHMGNGMGADFGVALNQLSVVWVTSTTVSLVTSTNANVTNTVPWTWGNQDKLSFDGVYETA